MARGCWCFGEKPATSQKDPWKVTPKCGQWLTNTTCTSGEQRSRGWLERGLTPCWLPTSGLSPHFPSQVLVSSPEFYLTRRGILIWQNRYDAWYFLLVQHVSVHAYLSAGMLGDNCEFLLFDFMESGHLISVWGWTGRAFWPSHPRVLIQEEEKSVGNQSPYSALHCFCLQRSGVCGERPTGKKRPGCPQCPKGSIKNLCHISQKPRKYSYLWPANPASGNLP